MFYAVKKGNMTGIFDNWADTESAVKGYPNPDFKKFNTEVEAQAYLENRDIWEERVLSDIKEGYLVAFTDGSYNEELNRYSYGVTFILSNNSEKNICGYGNNVNYLDSKNIIGEIFGVINALDWAISNGFEKIKIYHDYVGISKWINGEWKAKGKASQMFTYLYNSKFKDLLKIEFVKVPAHSNIKYNEKADQLAKSALVERKKLAIQGENWFSVPYVSKSEFDVICETVIEFNNNINFTIEEKSDKYIYKFKLYNESVVISLFKSGNQKLLVQGKNGSLFQIITTILVEMDEKLEVENVLGNVYRISINKETINNAYNLIENGLPKMYPINIKRLLKQCIINLNYYVECEDYSQYTFPALKALEGHIKYLINIAGGTVGRNFTCFGLNNNNYYITETFPNTSKNQCIEKCYNYYVSQRNSLFHFGDVLNSNFDNTRCINTKEDANEIIQKCIDLIITQQ